MNEAQKHGSKEQLELGKDIFSHLPSSIFVFQDIMSDAL